MSDVSPIPRRFISEAGNTTQALGVGRVVGQIYAFLYFSEPPRTLNDMTEALGISKGSASMGVRQLEQWGAVQQVWVKGDRKDYYTANDYFGQIIRNILTDIMGKRLEGLAASLDEAAREVQTSDHRHQTSDHRHQTSDIRLQTSDFRPKTEDPSPDNRQPITDNGAAEQRFLRSRIARLRAFQQKVNKTWNNPLVKMILK
jgi:DNA-binding transcriptional regulator GbsR (MarR family)